MYETEVDRLAKVFDVAVGFHHVGSTAIPGILAKSIIDILAEVVEVSEVDEYNGGLEQLGYRTLGENGITGRRYFEKGSNYHTHHLHVFATGSDEVSRHLNFRDYLRAHPRQAREYSELKKQLARKYKSDRESYTEGKSNFIRKIETRAREWKSNN